LKLSQQGPTYRHTIIGRITINYPQKRSKFVGCADSARQLDS
jgi:hypothetical protein